MDGELDDVEQFFNWVSLNQNQTNYLLAAIRLLSQSQTVVKSKPK